MYPRLGTGVLLEVDPAVENRPKHAIGESVAIFLDIVVRQVDLNIGYFVDFEGSRFTARLVGHLAAPAKPHAALIFERSFYRRRQFVSERGISLFRRHDPVGYNDEPWGHATSQLAFMSPQRQYCGP
jgi:hypothetical protein